MTDAEPTDVMSPEALLNEIELLIERQLDIFDRLVRREITPQEASRVHRECETRRRLLRALLDGCPAA